MQNRQNRRKVVDYLRKIVEYPLKIVGYRRKIIENRCRIVEYSLFFLFVSGDTILNLR